VWTVRHGEDKIPHGYTTAIDRLISRAYLLRELFLANLLPVPRVRILFSDMRDVKSSIAQFFGHTRHEISFGAFEPKALADYDVLVPLNLSDLRQLQALAHLARHNALPIPSADTVALCDDKLAFNRFLIHKGLGEFVPAILEHPEPPYVLKKRVSDRGRDAHVVFHKAEEAALLRGASPQDYFRQAFIEGAYEYATHALFLRGRLVRSLTIRYDMGKLAPIKGVDQPKRQRIVCCPFLDTFSQILSAVGFEGLCCIDFKVRGGRLRIMELNPRFGGSLCPYFFSFVRSLPRGTALAARPMCE